MASRLLITGLIASVLSFTSTIILVLAFILEDSIVSDVEQITCFIGDREVVITKDRIEGFRDGVWYFDNGYAKNCRVTK